MAAREALLVVAAHEWTPLALGSLLSLLLGGAVLAAWKRNAVAALERQRAALSGPAHKKRRQKINKQIRKLTRTGALGFLPRGVAECGSLLALASGIKQVPRSKAAVASETKLVATPQMPAAALELDLDPILAMGPMVGQSDFPFRLLCRQVQDRGSIGHSCRHIAPSRPSAPVASPAASAAPVPFVRA